MTAIQNRPAPPRTLARARTPVARQLLEIEMAGQLYGIPLVHVQEVVLMATLSGPPDLPRLLAGFLNLEGMAVPVLRLDRLFGLTEQPTGPYTPLVVLRGLGGPLALLAERVTRIRSVAETAVLLLPDNHVFNDCVEAMVTEDERVLLLLAPERLLLEKEQQCLAELQDREQTRLRALAEDRV
jgi:purine-binding chemotaxis protein CheW